MIEAAMIWNEPNNKSHWDPEVDPGWVKFCEMVILAAKAIRAENATLPRVLGGMSPIDPTWVQLLASRGVMDHLDAVAVHGFPLDWNLWSLHDWPAKIDEIRAVTDKPVWVSEVGVSTFGAEEVQDWGLKRTAELLRGKAPRIHWYSLYDLPKEWEATTRHKEAEGSSYYRHFAMGILRQDGTPKIAAEHFGSLTPDVGLCQWFHYEDHRLDDAVEHMKRLGVTYLRTGLSWADWLRPDAERWFDRLVRALEPFDTTVTFCFTPEEEGIEPHHTSAPKDPARFADFCATMVRRYVGSGPVKPIPAIGTLLFSFPWGGGGRRHAGSRPADLTPDTADLLVPRPHQVAARDAILAARAAGKPGFLLGDLTGLGKTLSVWSAIAAMPESEVLIVAPKGALPQWRRTIARSGLAPKTVTLTNYERSKALLALPEKTTRKSARAVNNELAREGRPKRVWPLVVFDESHRLRNPYSQQSMACRQVADAADFTVYLSATAGQSPHELSYLGRLLAHGPDAPPPTLAGYRELMRRLGVGGAKGRWTNWRWAPNDRDRAAMAALLYRGPDAVGLRRRPEEVAGWPEVQRDLSPTALTPAERRLYDATWRDFRRELGLLGGSTRRPVGWAADLRFRQKASLLRIPGTADAAEALLDGGQAVAVSVAYLETASMLADALRGRGWRVGAIDGRQTADANEAARVAFQTGALDALVFTVTESISLHANEMPGGERTRALLVHDMRHSAIQLGQIEGRCHRDGEKAVIHYLYAEETVEERIASTVVGRMAAMDGMAGDDTAAIDDIVMRIYGATG